eukprot:760412-Hanusia_phi.AAC.1
MDPVQSIYTIAVPSARYDLLKLLEYDLRWRPSARNGHEDSDEQGQTDRRMNRQTKQNRNLLSSLAT